MKTSRIIAIYLLAALLVGVFCASTFAFASSDNDYSSSPVLSNGKVVGTRMYGNFFGQSQIPVFVEIYSDGDSVGKNNTDVLFDEIASLLKKVEFAADPMSQTYLSDVSRINESVNGDVVSVSKETFEMLNIAKRMYSVTDGNYNPLTFRLVDLWGFSPRFANGVYKQYAQAYDRIYDYENSSYPLPSQEYISAFSQKEFLDFDNGITLFDQDGQYYVCKNISAAIVGGVSYEAWIDLGGIAKGYACDKIAELVNKFDVGEYFASVGESSVVFGRSVGGGNHNVLITDPFDVSASVCALNICNASVATSGVYQRYYTVQGERFCHIIGKDGYPVNNGLQSISVVAPQDLSAYSDCIATALIVGGKDYVIDFVNSDFAEVNGVSVLCCLQKTDGTKQLLSNVTGIVYDSANTYSTYGSALEQTSAGYVYNDVAPNEKNDALILFAIFCSVFAALAVAFVPLNCAKCRKNQKSTENFKKDKPFVKGDAVVYLIVATLVLSSFIWVATQPSQSISVIKVVDSSRGETLFSYNVLQNKWNVNDFDGWSVNVEDGGNVITVTLSKQDSAQFNKIEIVKGKDVSVKMTDSHCGVSKDCVKNFLAADKSDRVIVCRPNNIKIVTE